MNSSLGAPFALVRIFRISQTPSLVSILKILTNTKFPPQILELDSNKSESSLREFALANSWQSTIKISRTKCNRISPDSWCKKSESKGAVVPPADFLLESDKRGSPPKSEKRQLLARRGSGVGGAALLRKETSESKKQNGDFIVGFIKITDSIHLGFNP